MPRDDKGTWTPEAHKAAHYTEAEAARAQAALSAFSRAASPEAKPRPASHVRPVAAATTLQMVLTPTGQSRLAPNAQDKARINRAARMAEHANQKSFVHAQRDWLRLDLTKQFAKSNPHAKSKDNGLEM